jgi:hypothetical protein
VAAKLGVADLLRAGPKSSPELAAAVNVNPQALYRVLRALASLGIFAETDPGSFALTPLAEPLRSDVPGSLLASAVLYGEGWWWQACGELLHSIRTGQPAFDHVHGKPLFGYLNSASDAAAVFNDHQTNMTRQDAAAVVAAYDFTGCARVVDIGGGHGALAAAILRACPRTTVLLFDQPGVVVGAPQRLRAEGVMDRWTCVAGDFFDSVPPGGDAYVLKDIVHDWDDGQAIAILRNCRVAMTPAPAVPARLLVVEKVIVEFSPRRNHSRNQRGATMALNRGFTAPIVMALGGWKTERMMRRFAAADGAGRRAVLRSGSPVGLPIPWPSLYRGGPTRGMEVSAQYDAQGHLHCRPGIRCRCAQGRGQ